MANLTISETLLLVNRHTCKIIYFIKVCLPQGKMMTHLSSLGCPENKNIWFLWLPLGHQTKLKPWNKNTEGKKLRNGSTPAVPFNDWSCTLTLALLLVKDCYFSLGLTNYITITKWWWMALPTDQVFFYYRGHMVAVLVLWGPFLPSFTAGLHYDQHRQSCQHHKQLIYTSKTRLQQTKFTVKSSTT